MKNLIKFLFLFLILVHLQNGQIIEFKNATRYYVKDNVCSIQEEIDNSVYTIATFNFDKISYVEVKKWDKVRVKSGFYEGCEGVAVDIFYHPIEQIEVEWLQFYLQGVI